MNHLVRWELRQTFRSKVFWVFGITFVVLNFLLNLLDMIDKKDATGYELFLLNCNNINSFFVLSAGIFAGIHIAGAFEERRIQAAVMAGNSRWKIVLTKLLSFSLAFAIFAAASVGLSCIPAFLLTSETGVDSFGILLVQSVVYILALISFFSVCFVVSMWIKKLGAAIGVNFAVVFVMDICIQLVAGKSWGKPILQYTSIGQTMLTLTDSSSANLMTATFVSILGVLLSIVVTYIIFRKEELK